VTGQNRVHWRINVYTFSVIVTALLVWSCPLRSYHSGSGVVTVLPVTSALDRCGEITLISAHGAEASFSLTNFPCGNRMYESLDHD
jgi:hypothetical protein